MAETYDEAKLTELVLLVADRLRDDRAGGATKLNKVLSFADFAHCRRTGHSITGAEYQKLPQGPAPRRLLPIRDRLLRGGGAEVLADLAHLTAKHVSDLSHAEPGWLLVDDGETIPYEAALIAPYQHDPTSSIEKRGAAIALAYGLASGE
ncbi:MAG: Panacea domain-containing protein [Acidimicrobiia bacterium]|jgi:hypothetical protein